MLDRPMGLQARGHFAEINWPVALMDLDRIPATECDLRPACSGQVDKLSLLARLAPRPWTDSGNLGSIIGPEIK